MEQNLENLISKVKKLLALAGNNPNEQEAAAAAEKASRLMAEHNLSIAQVKKDTSGNERIEDKSGKSKLKDKWEKHIWSAVAELNFCKYWWSLRHGEITVIHNLIGTEANVESTKVMAEYLVQTVNRLVLDAFINKAQWPAFKLGASARLGQRLRELKKKRAEGKDNLQTGTNLPALADLYKVHQADNEAYFKSKHDFTLTKARKGRYSKDWVAYGMGAKAADGIGLDQQVSKNNQGVLR